MNLKEFKDRLDFIYKVAIGRNENIENLQVVVTTKDSSIGGRAKSNIKEVHRGIDWEHMQIRIETENDLIKKVSK